MRIWRLAMLLVIASLVGGCASQDEKEGVNGMGAGPPPDEGSQFTLSDIAKTDTNLVVETHRREVMGLLRQLMEKLYRRNPRELARGGAASVEAVVERVFVSEHDWQFPEFEGQVGAQCLHLAFRDDFGGDRVLAFIVGLGHMISASYNNKSQFFVLDSLDPQKLYNSARNIEIAAWKLNNAKDGAGVFYILANETGGPVVNISYERLFGKMIALQDVLSKVSAQKTRRAVKHTIQFIASAVFLPI